MGSKSFRCLGDFCRHGQNILLICGNGHCAREGIVDAWSASMWFRLHRWPEHLDGFMGRSALDRFRCKLCTAKAGRAKPTENAVTVVDFFPVGDAGWRMLQRRLRG